MSCLFCEIIKGKLPSKILFEDDKVIAILDAYPEANGHTLIIPKKHWSCIDDVPKEELMHIFEVATKLKAKLMTKLKVPSLSFLINYGEKQAIKHFHLHLLPGFGGKETLKSLDDIFECLNS